MSLKQLLIIGLTVLVISFAFFILTTWISTPTSMNLQVAKDGKEIPVTDSTVTLLLGRDKKIYAYVGKNLNNKMPTSNRSLSYIVSSITPAITKKFPLQIKPSAKAAYKDLVDLLDQVVINGIKYYSIVNITSKEENLLMGVD